MVFCNKEVIDDNFNCPLVTILILIDGFLQYNIESLYAFFDDVTILILIDGFLQSC